MVLKRALYGLKTASNYFQNIGDLIRDLGFTLFIAYQELWISKPDGYKVFEYISTHVDGLIIAADNESNYMYEVHMKFKVRLITYYHNYKPGNELILFGNRIYVTSKSYVN